ncbi:MAG: hypothetical protein EBV06_16945 [Planctomycetia bacterium]|nr:hypothetical protein [Planctomycetia bacterium]
MQQGLDEFLAARERETDAENEDDDEFGAEGPETWRKSFESGDRGCFCSSFLYWSGVDRCKIPTVATYPRRAKSRGDYRS